MKWYPWNISAVDPINYKVHAFETMSKEGKTSLMLFFIEVYPTWRPK